MTDRSPDSQREPHLRELIVKQLRQVAASDDFLVDREKCFAEAADRVLATLRAELLDQPNLSRAEMVASLEQSAPELNAEKTYNDFVQIRKRLVEEVRVGYLAGNLQMMKALGAAVAVRDTGSGEHNHRVTLYAARLAEALGLTNGDIQTLIKGSFLHDLGKISISDNILLKPEKLTDSESATMRSHPLAGAGVLREVKWLEDTYDLVVSHHEKFDGSGYPEGLTGEEIPLAARIFAVVDVFDALISERPYKAAYPYDQVIDYMRKQSGSHFDPEVLSVFFEISKTLCDEIRPCSFDILERMVAQMINQHFRLDLSEPRYRSKHSGL